MRIVCFNTGDGTSRDVTEDIAREIKDRSAQRGAELSPGLRNFIDWQIERSDRMKAMPDDVPRFVYSQSPSDGDLNSLTPWSACGAAFDMD